MAFRQEFNQRILDRCAAAAVRAIQQNLHSDRLGEIVVLAVVDELVDESVSKPAPADFLELGDVAAGIVQRLAE